ncbi:MAG: N-acetylneuraminate synthase [Candidatus Omnitrophica bacterium]|nr:N-acetylneuraminate synthase [Candidatus Omnitrophota bacterium]
MSKVFIIAEAGVNHNGSVKLAKRLIDAASYAGADAVKFQTFRARRLASRLALKAGYQLRATARNESQLQMLEKLELGLDAHRELIRHCRQKRIAFLSSPFDLESIDLLNGLGLRIFKIPSGEITNIPYLRKIGGIGKRVIVSTGMADLDEARQALNILVRSGVSKNNITFLHCTTAYPAAYRDVNLLAMLTIRDALGVNVGYSDHTEGIEISIAAVALGATVIEKHFTLDRNMKGPDHMMSLEPDQLKSLVDGIRNTEKAIGNGVKAPTRDEKRIKRHVRKSIVAKIDIPKGAKITNDAIDIKRPGIGVAPKYLDRIIGREARRGLKKDSLIRFHDLI